MRSLGTAESDDSSDSIISSLSNLHVSRKSMKSRAKTTTNLTYSSFYQSDATLNRSFYPLTQSGYSDKRKSRDYIEIKRIL